MTSLANLPIIGGAFVYDAAAVLILAAGCITAMLQSVVKSCATQNAVFGVLIVTLLAALGVSFFPAATSEHLQGAYLAGELARFGQIFILLVALVLIVLLKHTFLAERFFGGEISSIFQAVVLGMLVLVASKDLITIFIGLELSSLGIYTLVGYIFPNRLSQEGAVKYLILGSVATAILLFGFSLLYATSGSLDLTTIAVQVSRSDAFLWIRAAGIFIVAALAFKLALAPFHLWAPDAYEAAPTALTAFMATCVKITILIFFMRLSALGMDFMTDQWLPALMFLAIMSMLVGNIMALVQTSIKRTLAYSSVAHSGYMVVALCALSANHPLPYQAVLFYLIGYALTSLLAFGTLMWLENERVHNIQLADLSGLGKKHPLAAFALAVAMFSFAGMPPTVGFMGKFFVFNAALNSELYTLVLVGVAGSVISLFYYLRIVVRMYMHESADGLPSLNPSRSVVVGTVLGLAVAAILIFGTVAPESALRMLQPVVAELAMKP